MCRPLAEVLAEHNITGPAAEALIEREEQQADHLRLLAAQFGTYPEIVAAALAEANLGAITDEQRQFIRTQFVTLMHRLQTEG